MASISAPFSGNISFFGGTGFDENPSLVLEGFWLFFPLLLVGPGCRNLEKEGKGKYRKPFISLQESDVFGLSGGTSVSQTPPGNAPGKQRPSAVVFKTISTAFRSPVLDENPERGGRFHCVFRGRQKNVKKTRNPQREGSANTKHLSLSAVFNI